MTAERRVALIADAPFYVGPPLARRLAAASHDLVLGDPSRAGGDRSAPRRHPRRSTKIGRRVHRMDFPEFLRASGATDPEVRRRIEAHVPLGRLGTLDELAHFCLPYLDGGSRFVTGQFATFAGGWA